MKKTVIFQSSMSEPDKTEDWESLSIEKKDKIIRFQSTFICVLLLVIVYLAVQ